MAPNRPLIDSSIEQLERQFSEASAFGSRPSLILIADELAHRKTTRARNLEKVVWHALGGRPQPQTTLDLSITQAEHVQTTKPRAGQKPFANKYNFAPTAEQEQAIEFFRTSDSLKINAYAGTGKTSTLTMMSKITSRKGQYIAFNKSIVSDAKDKFSNNINCSTGHGLAFRATPSQYRSRIEKMTGKVNAHKIVEIFEFQKSWRIDKNCVLNPLSQASLILRTLQRFFQSADTQPGKQHVPRHGSLVAASDEVVAAAAEFAVKGASEMWRRMQDPKDVLPLGHDGYFKLWALAEPCIAADFILLDEAQDTNPVMLDVLRKQQAQIIYVGDRYQQIYEWRGAINAMEVIATEAESRLTQSFRFGQEIADSASIVLRKLGDSVPMVGNPKISSKIGPTVANAVLARTNATTISAIIDALNQQLKPHLVGGTSELMDMLRGVQELKQGRPTAVPDFFGFQSWAEVIGFAKSGDGDHLQTFVNLVETRGEKQLMWALNRAVDEDQADIVVSTAHKAKGREWQKVRLMDDFLRSKPQQASGATTDKAKQASEDAAELRLFYVAMTRARQEIEIPPETMDRFGLRVRHPINSVPPPLSQTPVTGLVLHPDKEGKDSHEPKVAMKPTSNSIIPKDWDSSKSSQVLSVNRPAPSIQPDKRGFFRRLFDL